MTKATRTDDLVALLQDQHRSIERATELLQVADGDRHSVLAELLADVRRHGRRVHDHLDPLVRRYLPDGQARADRQLSEHREIERVAVELRRCRPGDTLFDDLLGRLISQVRNQITEQEHELLPRLREQVPAEVLAQRGQLARHP